MKDRNAERLNFQPPSTNQQTYTPPTDIVSLPSEGKFYPEGHSLHNAESVEVYYMTTKEEDILVNASYNKEGIVYDKLIENLLANKHIDVNSLLTGDKNAILINARKNAYGPEYGIRVACEECFTDNTVSVNIADVKNKQSDYSGVEFTSKGTFLLRAVASNAELELKLLTGKDEKEIEVQAAQRAKHDLPEERITGRYKQMIVAVNGESNPIHVKNFIDNMPIADSRLLRKIYTNLAPDIDLNYEFACQECDHANKGGVPFTGDFFWPDE
tara:strand:+ start:2558 stop:3370 length:813 start_codon:yes stop_codon:yes gene_type:complete